MKFKLFFVVTVLLCSVLLGTSMTLAQNNEIENESKIYIRNVDPDSRVEVMVEDIRRALQDFAGDQHIAELVILNGEVLLQVSNLDGEPVDMYHTGLADNIINMDILSVAENGEVISANPYISSSSEK